MQDEQPVNENAPTPASMSNRKGQKKPIPKLKLRSEGALAAKTTERQSVIVETIELEEEQNLNPEPTFAIEVDKVEESRVPEDSTDSDINDNEEDATNNLAEEETAEEELGESSMLEIDKILNSPCMLKNACERIGWPQSMLSSNLIQLSNMWMDGASMCLCVMQKHVRLRGNLGKMCGVTWIWGIQNPLATYIDMRRFAGEMKL